MSRLGINTGTNPNDGQGDSLRRAMGKINSNFQEVYNVLGDGENIVSYANTSGISTLSENLTGSPIIQVSGILNTGITTTEHIEVTNITSTGIITAVSFRGDGSQLENVIATGVGLEILDDSVRKGVASELNFTDGIVAGTVYGSNRIDISLEPGFAVGSGSQGLQGIQGISGPGGQGSQGIQGTDGPKGDDGLQGDPGLQGLQGLQGLSGIGSTGAQGITGAQGTYGTQGLQGIQGLSGIGSTGTQGLDGTQGSTGSQGTTGTQGTTGQQGIDGESIQGSDGSQGIQGITGTSVQGQTGSQGETGPQGTDGVQGQSGSSVTIQGAVATSTSLPGWPSSYVGSVGDGYITQDTGHLWVWDGSSWDDVGNVTGPQGIQGTTGTQGADGSQGIQGITGSQGQDGTAGTQGADGVQGETGADSTVAGPQGADGVQGVDGSQGIQGISIQGVQGPEGGGVVGSAGTWAVNVSGIHTSKYVGIGTEISNAALWVEGDGWYSGVVTATRFESQSAGTPTITSPNNLNINAVTVAISTDLTVGGDAYVGIDTSSGLILTSPNSTQYRLVVDDSGNLSTVVV